MTLEQMKKYGIKSFSMKSETNKDSVVTIEYENGKRKKTRIKLPPKILFSDTHLLDFIDKEHNLYLRKKKIIKLKKLLRKK